VDALHGNLLVVVAGVQLSARGVAEQLKPGCTGSSGTVYTGSASRLTGAARFRSLCSPGRVPGSSGVSRIGVIPWPMRLS
jgi:hypothetical protein